MALRECQVSIDCRDVCRSKYGGWLSADGAGKVLDFLRIKGFRIIR